MYVGNAPSGASKAEFLCVHCGFPFRGLCSAGCSYMISGSRVMSTVNVNNFSLGFKGRGQSATMPSQAPVSNAPVPAVDNTFSLNGGAAGQTAPKPGFAPLANSQLSMQTLEPANTMGQNPAPQAANVSGFSPRKVNTSGFSLGYGRGKPAAVLTAATGADATAAAIDMQGMGSATDFFLGNPGVGRGSLYTALGRGTTHNVPSLNNRTVAPPPGELWQFAKLQK